MSIIITIYAFVLGAVFGSFFNMLVYRIHIKQGILGYSYCDKTGNKLTPLDLIPIISYIIYKGRCRECGSKVNILYPIIEFINGLIWVATGLLILNNLNQIIWLILLLVIIEIIFVILLYKLQYK
jgi:prepilin signal peptidase PulO-like enzyme (type II secretory pathway)